MLQYIKRRNQEHDEAAEPKITLQESECSPIPNFR